MSSTKTALTITSIATAALFGGGVYIYMNMGSFAKTLAQDYASKTLGVPVSIGRIDIDLPNLNVDVLNIAVSNPSGYERANIVTIDKVNIAAESLSMDLLHFKNISVEGTNLYPEINLKGSNFTDMKKNLKTDAGTPSDESMNPIKLIIDKAVIDGTVHPKVSFLEKDIEPIKITPVQVTRIGQKTNGALAGEAIAQIWKPLSSAVMTSVSNAGYLEGISAEAAKEIGQKKMDAVKEKIGDKVKNITGGLKSLLDR